MNPLPDTSNPELSQEVAGDTADDKRGDMAK